MRITRRARATVFTGAVVAAAGGARGAGGGTAGILRELRATGALPDEAQIVKTRRLVMVQAHILPLIPLAAVFLARGFGK